MTEPLVRCERVVVGFGRRALLPPIDLQIAPGELVLVVGHNGAGKTTLVRTLLGLVRPLSGGVRRRAGLRCTYVPQASAIDALVPLQVDELVAWGGLRAWSFLRPWARLPAPVPPPASALPVDPAMSGAVPSIEAYRKRRFGELSGGQRQRVLLARLLAGDAELAVLDEPTASMDGPGSEATFAELRRLTNERGTTSLVVTHAAAAAAPYADRIALLDPEGGGLVIGPPREVAAAPRFRGLFGAIELAASSLARRAGAASSIPPAPPPPAPPPPASKPPEEPR